LKRVFPELEILLIMRRKLHQKRQYLGVLFNKVSKSVCTSPIVVSCDSLSPTLSTAVMKTAENTEDFVDLEK
jgi:hypothetical protein